MFKSKKILRALVSLAEAYNDCVNRNEQVPEAKDYNYLLDLIAAAAEQAGIEVKS